MLASLLNDVRYAVRGFARRPVFAVVVVLTLAAGIGAERRGVLSLRPTDAAAAAGEPTRRAGQFHRRRAAAGQPRVRHPGRCDELFSYPMFRDLEAADGPFAGIAASRLVPTNFGCTARPDGARVRWQLVSGKYFRCSAWDPRSAGCLGPPDDGRRGRSRHGGAQL